MSGSTLAAEGLRETSKRYAEILSKIRSSRERRIYELGIMAGHLLQRTDLAARQALKRNLDEAALLGVRVGRITGGTYGNNL